MRHVAPHRWADAADGRVFPYIFPLITTYWSRDAFSLMLNLTRPRFVFPAHGDHRRLHLHAELFKDAPELAHVMLRHVARRHPLRRQGRRHL